MRIPVVVLSKPVLRRHRRLSGRSLFAPDTKPTRTSFRDSAELPEAGLAFLYCATSLATAFALSPDIEALTTRRTVCQE